MGVVGPTAVLGSHSQSSTAFLPQELCVLLGSELGLNALPGCVTLSWHSPAVSWTAESAAGDSSSKRARAVPRVVTPWCLFWKGAHSSLFSPRALPRLLGSPISAWQAEPLCTGLEDFTEVSLRG